MNFYEQEMRKMFADNDIIYDAKFCGKAMIGKLDDELRVKIYLTSTFMSNECDAIRAAIINRKNGIVDNHIFCFSDILGMQKSGNDIVEKVRPRIWEYKGEAEWSPPITAESKAKIADTILEYVEMFQQE